jgi:hypothetical protein
MFISQIILIYFTTGFGNELGLKTFTNFYVCLINYVNQYKINKDSS